MDTSVSDIFARYSIEEVRRICVDIRNDVENKKVELRFLVGERHRDVIEASDNILFMKRHSNYISDALRELEINYGYNAPIDQSKSHSCNRASSHPKKRVAAQLKLLLDIPELIWSALDEYDFTNAVAYFCLGRHLSVKLQLSGEMLAANVNARVLLKRQWASLDHIENTIVTACRKQLVAPFLSHDVLQQVLTTLLVLEDQSMQSSLGDYLAGRTSALSNIMETGDSATISIDGRLSAVAKILLDTLQTVSSLFLLDGLVACQLERLCEWSPGEEAWFACENLFAHLPDDIASFHITSTVSSPVVNRQQSREEATAQTGEGVEGDAERNPHRGVRALPLQLHEITEQFTSWWQKTLVDCNRHLTDSLRCTKDLRALSEARVAVIKTALSASLQQHPDNRPLGRPVDLWAELYRPVFLIGLENALESRFGEILDEFEDAFMRERSRSTLGVDGDLGSFVWSQDSAVESDFAPHSSPSAESATAVHSPCDKEPLAAAAAAGGALTYFACLVGRRDLLSTTPGSGLQMPPAPAPPPSFSAPSTWPHPWHLERLLEAASRTYRLLHGPTSTTHPRGETVGDGGGRSREALNLKWRLVSPALRKIIARFNRQVIDAVATSAFKAERDEFEIWALLFRAVQHALDRLTVMAEQASADLREARRGCGALEAFFVARACLSVVEVCPALGAVVATATALQHRQENPEGGGQRSPPRDSNQSTTFAAWSDVLELRKAWINQSRQLRSAAARLSLEAILTVTASGSAMSDLPRRLRQLTSETPCVSTSDESVVANTAKWTEIQLKSPSDQGSGDPIGVVTARVKVPTQPSHPLHEALLSVSSSLIGLSVHLLPRGQLGELFGLRLAQNLLTTYRDLADTDSMRFSQSQALQLMFDVRFILRLLVWPLATSRRRSVDGETPLDDKTLRPMNAEELTTLGRRLLSRFESAVDPFDLEMSSSRLDANLGRAVRDCSCLYASLLPVTASAPNANDVDPQSTAEEEAGNTGLLLVPTAGSKNFALLPFSLSSVRPTPPQPRAPINAEKSKAMPTSRGSTSDFSWFSGLSFS